MLQSFPGKTSKLLNFFQKYLVKQTTNNFPENFNLSSIVPQKLQSNVSGCLPARDFNSFLFPSTKNFPFFSWKILVLFPLTEELFLSDRKRFALSHCTTSPAWMMIGIWNLARIFFSPCKLRRFLLMFHCFNSRIFWIFFAPPVLKSTLFLSLSRLQQNLLSERVF